MLPHAWLWTLAVIAVLLLPSACAFIAAAAARRPDEVLPEQHLAATASVAGRDAAQTALTLAFLPYEATVNLDAIARTAWRMLVTHRQLLEWNPSARKTPIAARDGAQHRVARTCGVGQVDVDRAGDRRGTAAMLLAASDSVALRPPRRSSCCGSCRRPSPGG